MSPMLLPSCIFIAYRFAVANGLAAVGVGLVVAAAHRPVHSGAQTAVWSLSNAGVDLGGHHADEKKLELDHIYSYPLLRRYLTIADVMVVCPL